MKKKSKLQQQKNHVLFNDEENPIESQPPQKRSSTEKLTSKPG